MHLTLETFSGVYYLIALKVPWFKIHPQCFTKYFTAGIFAVNLHSNCPMVEPRPSKCHTIYTNMISGEQKFTPKSLYILTINNFSQHSVRDMSCVTCHVSNVTCHMSHAMCHMSYFYFYFLDKEDKGYWWRVCYQQNLLRLVFHTVHTYKVKVSIWPFTPPSSEHSCMSEITHYRPQ